MTDKDFWHKRMVKNTVLSPVDRTSEILFGLIMVLTFTGAISASSDGREEIRALLWAALGCNVAWGLVDAIMYLMNVIFDRGYSRRVLIKIKNAASGSDSLRIIREEFQPIVTELLDDEQMSLLEKKIRELPEAPPVHMLLTGRDLNAAFRIFLLVFLCTLPVSLPFGIFEDPALALRVSNGVALVMLFAGGYNLAIHAGFRPFITGLVYMLIGVVLVAVTMALGG